MDGQKPNLDILTGLLKRQISLHRDLMDLVKREREHLVKADIKAIGDATFEKEALVAEVQKSEIDRGRWITAVAAHVAEEPETISLERIIGIYGEEHREQLQSLRATLRVLISKIRELNLDNAELTRNALTEAQVMKQNALGMTADRANVYGPKGKMGGGKDRSSRMVSSEA